jgi:hypothetical protein
VEEELYGIHSGVEAITHKPLRTRMPIVADEVRE